jgi:hypothetical protein
MHKELRNGRHAVIMVTLFPGSDLSSVNSAPNSDLNRDPNVRPFGGCQLQLNKPLSARTAFLLLKMPVFIPKNRRQPEDTTFRPVFSLEGVHLAPGAHLHDRFPIDLESVTFDLSLKSCMIPPYAREHPGDEHDEQAVVTALALLKLLGMQIHPYRPSLLSAHPDSRFTHGCQRAWFDVPIHFGLMLDVDALEVFIARVGYRTVFCLFRIEC